MDPHTGFAPFGIDVDFDTGEMRAAECVVTRRASDMRGYYRDEKDLDRIVTTLGDPVHYEVLESNIPEEYGHLRVVISRLQPGRVGDEFFMTKGHYHTVSETAEVYLCLRGEGIMVMKTSEGHAREERMARQRLVYVPPHWAHRSVNTGAEPLVSLCVYPGEAGHNYGDIVDQGFPQRVIYKNGEVVIERVQPED